MGSQCPRTTAWASFELDLTELRNQAVSKKWYALEGGEGEIELILQWYP